jgi:hypothetical protein
MHTGTQRKYDYVQMLKVQVLHDVIYCRATGTICYWGYGKVVLPLMLPTTELMAVKTDLGSLLRRGNGAWNSTRCAIRLSSI